MMMSDETADRLLSPEYGDDKPDEEEAGYWQPIQTDSGWHLCLMGANHEKVLVSQVYDDPRSVADAVELAVRTTEIAFLKDERTNRDSDS